MNENKNGTGGTSAPDTSQAPLVCNTRRVPAKAQELLHDQHNGLPIWIRSPKQGVEFHTGLSRAKLYELTGAGKIKSVSIREPGQVKGTRLFNLQSILDFIAKCEHEATDKTAAQKGAVQS